MTRSNNKPISPELSRKLAEEYASGKPVKVICYEYNVHGTTVRRAAKRHGYDMRTPLFPKRLKRGLDRLAVALAYEQGVPTGQIAESFGIHRTTIRIIAKEFGLPPRPPGWVKRPQTSPQPVYTKLGSAIQSSHQVAASPPPGE